MARTAFAHAGRRAVAGFCAALALSAVGTATAQATTKAEQCLDLLSDAYGNLGTMNNITLALKMWLRSAEARTKNIAERWSAYHEYQARREQYVAMGCEQSTGAADLRFPDPDTLM